MNNMPDEQPGKEQKMSADTKNRDRLKFRIGITLVVVSYVVWGAMFVFSALALSGKDFPWWHLAAAAFVLSWMTFGAGILFAGPAVVHSVRNWIVSMMGPGSGEAEEEKDSQSRDDATNDPAPGEKKTLADHDDFSLDC